ncbi:MAG: FUSC family protein [Porticoccaceae bacterium]
MMTDWFSRNGFDPARLRFGFRTALACCAALTLAWLMGLEHPQWSGMSVWAASQPLRGQLLEKSFFRFAGTVAGTALGVLLVIGGQFHPAILVVGLAFWVAACTWVGNLQRGLVAYGTVLAGYSASMVALLDTAHPEQVFHLGADRLATVLTGVVVATLVGYFFAQRTDEADLRGRIRSLLADLLRHLADPGAAGASHAQHLSRLAAIEEELDPHTAGSLRSRREARTARAVLLATVPLLLREEHKAALDPLTTGRLAAAADAIEQDDLSAAQAFLDVAETSPLRTILCELAGALRAWDPVSAPGAVTVAAPKAPPVVLHRDWIGAREAGLRAGGAMLLFGAIWLATGWGAGAYMLLGLSVMISLFSTFESPAITMRHVFTGQVLGVFAAMICRWLVWPHAEGEWQQIVLMSPFILSGSLLVAHRSTLFAATDFNMLFLLLSQPHFPLSGELQDSFILGFAVLAAPLIAWAGYLLVFPINLQRRQQHLLAMMQRDLISLARNPQAASHGAVWQARIYHRVLRLVRISEHLARAEEKAEVTGRAVLVLTHAALRCHELQSETTSSATGKIAQLALRRLEHIPSGAARASATFRRLARQLEGDDARLMEQAADGLTQLSTQDAPA